MKLILGSSSQWRQQVLKDAGYKFSTRSPNIDEKSIRNHNPEQLVLKLAHAKADALLSEIHEPTLLITSDQIVVCNNKIFEKPTSKQEIKYFHDCYNQHPAQTVTSIVITNTVTKKRAEGINTVNIEFFKMPRDYIEQATHKSELFLCAGGFQIEKDNALNPYIKHIDGTIDSVKGLPLKLLSELLEEVKNSALPY